MKVLYISYWGLEDGLTQSTILPFIKVLKNDLKVEQVALITTERQQLSKASDSSSFIHFPLYVSTLESGVIKKAVDFWRLPKVAISIARQSKPDLIIARGVFAGSIAYRIHRNTGIPFITESFEPHTLYMINGGVWRKNGLKARMLGYWMKKQLLSAKAIVTVSKQYQDLLYTTTGKTNIYTIPCVVDPNVFFPNSFIRETARKELGLDTNITGIYVGKFGGIYMDKEALIVFKKCFEQLPQLRIILLTDQKPEELHQMLMDDGLDPQRFIICFVPHHEVNRYLNAADFAFSLIKPTPSSMYCSPVKNGEYWAAGLPLLIPDNIGDDSTIVKQFDVGGAVFNNTNDSLDKAIQHIVQVLNNPQHKNQIRELALKFRNPGTAIEVYNKIMRKADN